jgi:hypothetical protein
MLGQLMLLLVSVSVSSGANAAAGGEKCEVQCGFDYFGRPQYWMSETEGLDRCDVIDLIDNNAYQNFWLFCKHEYPMMLLFMKRLAIIA